jgi:peptide/nickel transport system substrate-binding protein
MRSDSLPGSDATRRQILAAMGGAAAVGVAGCAGNGDDSTATEEPDDDDEMTETDDSTPGDTVPTGEFTASVAANPSTFDPTIVADATSASTVASLAYESLVTPTFDLSEFRGLLASEFERVDETTYRFQLREGVTFHNGDEFTAEDVEFSINRTSGTTNDADVAWIESVDVQGDYEIVINSSEPHAPALTDLGAVPILPSGADSISENPQEDDHDFQSETLGTGPYTIEEFQAEDRLVMTAYGDYWYDGGDYPSTSPWETVTFRVIPEQVSQEEAMQTGELDVIDNAAPFDLQQWEGATGTVVKDVAVGFDFITFPVNQEPYTNPDFRRGMTRLIPREDVIEAIFGGNATPLAGPISPGLGAYFDAEEEQRLRDEFVGEDVEAAEELLDSAFEEEDIEKPFEVSLITNVNRTRERWMEVVQQRFDETEYFDAELDVRSFDDLVPFLLDPEGAAQSTDVVGIGWTGGSDPDGHVAQLLHSRNHVPDGFNWNLYENDEVDQLIDEGQTTVDVDERSQIYSDLQEVLAEDSPMAFMWTGDQIDIVNSDSVASVGDWQPHPNSSSRYDTLYAPVRGEIVVPPEN